MIASIQASFSPLVVLSELAMIKIGNIQIRKQPTGRARARPRPTIGISSVEPSPTASTISRTVKNFIVGSRNGQVSLFT